MKIYRKIGESFPYSSEFSIMDEGVPLALLDPIRFLI